MGFLAELLGQWEHRRWLLVGMIVPVLFAAPAFATSIFVNEFHYDNDGSDLNEGVEIAAPGGTDLSGWSLVFYNGANGLAYSTKTLSGVVVAERQGYGTLFVSVSGMQNGSPDGFALVDASNSIRQFLSYEGSFTAAEGPAIGRVSLDIGIAETSSSPSGWSLQLAGSSLEFADFGWVLAEASYGRLNAGQNFVDMVLLPQQVPVPTPEPGTLLLFGLGGGFLWLLRKKKGMTAG